MCYGFSGSLEVIYQLLIDVGVLTVWKARLQQVKVMP